MHVRPLGASFDRVRALLGAAVLLLVVAACATTSAFAQQVRVANNHHAPFRGWVRAIVDEQPPHDVCRLPDGTLCIVAGQRSPDRWAVDLRLSLAARERRVVDLAGAVAAERPVMALPGDLLEHFAGWPDVGGVPFEPRAIDLDGAAIAVHWFARPRPMLAVHLWTRWYPDQPGLVTGEVAVVASNAGIPDTNATVEQPLRLSWGDGAVYVCGGAGIIDGLLAPIVPAGTSFADGQARGMPIAIAWPRHLHQSGEEAFRQFESAIGLRVSAIGVRELWPHGNPQLPAGFDAVAWTKAHFGPALARLHTWDAAPLGPAPNSSVTGAQEDQTFVRGEMMLPGGEGAEQVAYLVALHTMARPCHHLEASGRQCDPVDHPQCVFWTGRPHYHRGVSPDRLGKPIRPDGSAWFPTIDECHGWNGPDREHWLINTTAAAARVIDSPALQFELQQQARIFLFQETTQPGWSTSSPDAARSVGWAGIVAVHLWRGLDDRDLAERVRQRWIDRARLVYLPELGAKPYDVWDVRRDDRIGSGERWMAWQQSIGSYGLYLAAREFDVPEAKAMAVRAAKRCVASNWAKDGSRWLGVVNPPFPPPEVPELPPEGTPQWYVTTWDLPALWVTLREDPAHAKARACWNQAMADLGAGLSRSWVPPGAVPPAPPDAPQPPDQPQVPTATFATCGDFRWTFAEARQVGAFVTGEPWVVGPVTITAIAPAPAQVGTRWINGSTLNPTSCTNGYDSESFGPYNDGKYQHARNVALQLPLTIATGSLVSAMSAVPRPASTDEKQGFLVDAAVLTVLDAPPPPDSFRPSYVGTDKSIPGTLSQVDWSALASLPPAPGMPAAGPLLDKLRHLWLDHCTDWVSRYLHVQRGLGDYYRTFTGEIGTAALLANCAGVPEPVRRELCVRLIQIGIDNHALVASGARWGVNGHCNGRKFPVLFAGRMLGRADMLAAGVDHALVFYGPGDARNRKATWSEDGQCFYVEETSPGVFNWGFGGYTAQHRGMAEWGNFHADQIQSDSVEWDLPYRVCCSANGWIGQTLTMRIMGLVDEWNHAAYFDYVDRYMNTMQVGDWRRSDPWHGAMWDAYRASF